LHFRQLADGSPDSLEFISALNLLVQRLFGNLLLADARPGKLPLPVGSPQKPSCAMSSASALSLARE
jgi:hypothetical protein